MLGGSFEVEQASLLDCLLLDALALEQDGLCSTAVDVGGCEIVQAPVVGWWLLGGDGSLLRGMRTHPAALLWTDRPATNEGYPSRIAGPSQRTLPMQMFGGLREHLDPTITAAATLMIRSLSCC
jgi:hypothetical protein